MGGWFRAPNDIFSCGLNNYEIVVYLYIVRMHNNNRKGAFPSKATIATACGISKPTVNKSVEELKKKGLLTIKRRSKEGKNDTNIYIPHAPSNINSTSKENDETQDAKQTWYELSNEFESPFLTKYLEVFKESKERKHPRVNEEQISSIKDFLDQLVTRLDNREFDFEDYEAAVENYFVDLPSTNNGSILAFIHAAERVLFHKK